MTVQSVARALKILSLFNHRRAALGISDISRLMELPKGTVHGLTRTLVASGFLHQDRQTRKYRLGLKIHELGIVLASTLELNQKASGPCHQLSQRTQAVVRLGIWDGDSVVITLIHHPNPYPVLPYQVGPRIHAYCSAVGKAILSHLEERKLKEYLAGIRLTAYTVNTITVKKKFIEELKQVKKSGYAYDREEAVQGMGCIGAPIFDSTAEVAGALSLSGPVHHVFGKQKETLTQALLSTAAEISQYLGFYPGIMGDQAL